MILYLINTLLAIFLAWTFYKTKDGMLRKLMIWIFGGIAYYQLIQLLIRLTDLQHGTPISYYSKLPFTLAMLFLTIYIYKIQIIKYYNKCGNLLTKLLKRVQK